VATASRGCLVNRFASASAVVDLDNWRPLRPDGIRVPLVPGRGRLYAGRLPWRPVPIIQCSVGFHDAIIRFNGRSCRVAPMPHATQRDISLRDS